MRAQTPSERVVGFLESAGGFSLLGEIQEGALREQESAAISATFLEGSDYMVVGFCDAPCANLDLVLTDPDGGELQADTLPDREPILTFTPESLGPVNILVRMVDCAAERCGYAVGILGRSQERGVVPGEDMLGRLALFASELTVQGFTEVGDHRRGALNTDQAVGLPLTVQAGLQYRIVGVCDQDCLDLDLALYDSAGVELASDYLDDALPILAFSPKAGGEMDLEVIMVACGLEPCAFRVATYAKGETIGPGGASFSGELLLFETHHGQLEGGDTQLSGTYLDEYAVEAQAGQRIIVDLRSDHFDTLLRLLDPEGSGEENDDYGAETGHSHIEFLALLSGVYSVQVTSFDAGSTGEYVLQIAVVQ